MPLREDEERTWYITEESIEKFVIRIRTDIEESKLPTVVVTGILQGILQEIWVNVAQRTNGRKERK